MLIIVSNFHSKTLDIYHSNIFNVSCPHYETNLAKICNRARYLSSKLVKNWISYGLAVLKSKSSEKEISLAIYINCSAISWWVEARLSAAWDRPLSIWLRNFFVSKYCLLSWMTDTDWGPGRKPWPLWAF